MRRMLLFLLVVAIASGTGVRGQQAPTPKGAEWTTYGGDLASTRYSPLDQINQRQLQQARGRVAVQDRRARSAAGVQLPVDAADGQRRRLLHRRLAPRRRRARRRHRRDAVDAQPERRQARRVRAAAALRTRARLLDRRQASERIVYVTPGYQMVALDAKTGVPVAGFGKNGIVDLKTEIDQPMDPITGEIGLHATPIIAKDVIVIGAAHLPGGAPKSRSQREGLHPRLRRPHRQASVDLPHDSAGRRVRQRHVGKGFLVVHRQRRRVGADDDRRRARTWSICRSSCRPATTTAAIVRARTSSPKASSRST